MTALQQARKDFNEYINNCMLAETHPRQVVTSLISTLESANREMYEVLKDCIECSNYCGRKCRTNEILEKYKPE